MPDKTQRRCLFVAIDRATRWVFVHIDADQSEASSCDFLRRLNQAAPMKISELLTDNGNQLTNRFTGKTNNASGQHAFENDAPACRPSIAWHRPVTRRPTAWPIASMAESPTSSGRRASNLPQSSRPR